MTADWSRRPRRGPRGGPGEVAAFEDAYQVLRANLTGAMLDIKQPRVMVTSPSAREGKTITCVNLAVCFAKAGQRVLVVDLDLRHPDAHRLMGAHNDYGLTDLLMQRRPPEKCLQFLRLPAGAADGGGSDKEPAGLYFLGTGKVAENPAELLSMERTSKVLDLIGEQVDVMLIDSPPVIPFADASVIGRMVSGALVVVQARRSTLPELNRAKDVLLRNQTRLFGVVLNRFDRRDQGYWEAPVLPGIPPQSPGTSE